MMIAGDLKNVPSEDDLCISSSSSGVSSPITSRPSTPELTRPYVSLSEKIHQRILSGNKFFSLEFFPPHTKSGAVNLLSRFDRMGLGGPLFCDITWHNTSNNDESNEVSSMAIASAALNYSGLETMLHLTCCTMSKETLTHHLNRAKQLGIRNILALRGDPPSGVTSWKPPKDGFNYAVDLVRYIRETFDDYFVICVAGYPIVHPDALSYADDLNNLKAKVDAGADFIITQLFYDVSKFKDFVRDCRSIGIQVPIIPGVMPIQSWDSLRNIVKLSKCEIPSHILDVMNKIRGNDQAIRKFGVDLAVNMCSEIFNDDLAPGLHFYTLNREVATVTILKKLGMWHEPISKPLPWSALTNHHKRCTEDVRPIFWSVRQKSYVHRTMEWDEFPNGRWGKSESPAFGELKYYHLFALRNKNPEEELLDMWGCELNSEQDIWDVFYNYVSEKPNKKGILVRKTPWNDDELNPETSMIADKLADVNKKGVLTINSQPNINGWPSAHEVIGWGVPGGYVYQKAYLEFFTSQENIVALKEVLRNYPRVNYHIINKSGGIDFTNCHKHNPIAVTWGVFPGREIIQPTIVDPESFKVWKDEAFSLWIEEWAKLYDETSESWKLINHVTQTYYLVNLVDNHYPEDNCLWDVLDAMFVKRDELSIQKHINQ